MMSSWINRQSTCPLDSFFDVKRIKNEPETGFSCEEANTNF